MNKPLNNHYILNISSMNCGHCVATVSKTALAVNGVVSIDVDLENAQASVVGGEAEQLIKAISDAGFPATLKADEADKSDKITSNTSVARNSTTNEQNQPQQSYSINIEDMTCASCVSSVEKAIFNVAGVSNASVNLLEKTASVYGGEPSQVVKAIINKGYQAQLEKKKS